MSCFIVEADTIGTIVSYIFDNPWAKQHIMQHQSMREPSLLDNDYEEGLMYLAHAMTKLNHAAFAQRYGWISRIAPYKTYAFSTKPPVQVLKSLACFLYQCTEGDIPERGLYKALESLWNKLAARIVYNSQEYIEAPWE